MTPRYDKGQQFFGRQRQHIPFERRVIHVGFCEAQYTPSKPKFESSISDVFLAVAIPYPTRTPYAAFGLDIVNT